MHTASEKRQTTNTNSGEKRELVLFDFDGTLTTKDTLAEFMIFYHGKAKYYLGLAILSPVMGLYLTGLMENWKAKEIFLSWFLKNEEVSKFNERCTEFARRKLPGLVRKGAIDMIRKYRDNGATIAVVSASAENWVKPFCDQHGLICLSTKLDAQNGTLTGKIAGKNCHGPEKVCRINEHFVLTGFDHIIAYGDTSGDKEMLALADTKFYKPFRD
ncbi:MAG TPA: HAD-IB family hydrolase [Chryseosolibacter sp.]|nr:HAD-IB family hydrolase [Chryseosolibacter sp.]